MKPLNYDQALCKAAALCSSSEHCTYDIDEKLRKWGVPSADREKIIDYLIDEKYIDNKRYCRAFCLDKFRYNHWGRVKIAQTLRMQGMSDSEVSEGLSHIPEEEYKEAIQDAIQKKDRTLKDDDDYIRRGKIIRHLLSRGFEMDCIMEQLD